jgi:TetR/AcrR family fatty acid metabolism transcriptional regulator
MANSRKRLTDKANHILEAALKVFGEKGYYDATISDIAKAARVSEATLYEYFAGKEDILFSIPAKLTREGIELSDKIDPYIKGAENRLRALVYGYFYLYRDNPNYSRLVLLDLKHNRKFLETEAYQLVRRAAGNLLAVIREGMASGEFQPDLDPYLVRSMLLGTIEHIFFRWHLLDRQVELADFVDPMLEMLLSGIRKKEETSSIVVKMVDARNNSNIKGKETA